MIGKLCGIFTRPFDVAADLKMAAVFSVLDFGPYFWREQNNLTHKLWLLSIVACLWVPAGLKQSTHLCCLT